MIQDFRDYEEGAVLEADLCIVGAGAAGITLALELVGSGLEVLVVESGGLEAEPETLALNRGKVVGLPCLALDASRLRFLGGSTNHWDAHCRPLDPIDLEKRPWVPYSGWPIEWADLDRYYPRAQQLCELGPCVYAPEHWSKSLPGLIDFDPARVVNRLWQYGPPTRFGQRYRADLQAAAKVRVLLNANVVDIEVNEAASLVTGLRIKALEGPGGRIRAGTVVLAAGGIENPHLLLAANSVMKPGLGNAHDLVGRFFMDHPHALTGFAVPAAELEQFAVYFGGVEGVSEAGRAILQAKPGLSEVLQREQQLPNICVDVGYGYDRSSGYLALREAASGLQSGQLSDELGEAVIEMVSDLDGLAGGLYRRLAEQDVLWFGANAEQLPNPDSRVLLNEERDSLGMPRVRLDWRLTEADKTSLRRACRIVGEELARLGVARVRMDDWLTENGDSWEGLGGRCHHMGTTRMSDDPKAGVVDRDCRVHGIANLYVAGSSVFPTGGYAHPTLTIVALAVRLAEHLKTVRDNTTGAGTGTDAGSADPILSQANHGTP